MNLRHLYIACPILLVISAPSAIANDIATPVVVKAPAHVAKTKTKTQSVVPATGLDIKNINISDPDAPLIGTAKPPKPAAPSKAAREPTSPKTSPSSGFNPSFDLKWHADNDRKDPYLSPSIPAGTGAGVEAGVKVGF